MNWDRVFDWVRRNAGNPTTPDLTLKEYILLRNYQLLAAATSKGGALATAAQEAWERGMLYPTIFAEEWCRMPHRTERDLENLGNRISRRAFEDDAVVASQYILHLIDTIDDPDALPEFIK